MERISKGADWPRLVAFAAPFDTASAALEQGIFLLNNGSAIRVDPDGKISDSELVFLVPPMLAPGEYKLEVRAVFGKNDLRSGRLAATLTVPLP